MLASFAVWTPFIYAIHGIMDTIRSVDTIFNEIHGIVGIIRSVNTIHSVDTIFNKIPVLLASSAVWTLFAVWTPFLTKSTVLWTNTIRSVDTILNEIHGIVGIIRSVDTIYLRHPRYYGHHPQCGHHI